MIRFFRNLQYRYYLFLELNPSAKFFIDEVKAILLITLNDINDNFYTYAWALFLIVTIKGAGL